MVRLVDLALHDLTGNLDSHAADLVFQVVDSLLAFLCNGHGDGTGSSGIRSCFYYGVCTGFCTYNSYRKRRGFGTRFTCSYYSDSCLCA